jgi:hypothetical protein
MRTPAHAQANAAISDKGDLSQEMLGELRRHRWVRNFYLPNVTWADKVKDRIQSCIKIQTSARAQGNHPRALR